MARTSQGLRTQHRPRRGVQGRHASGVPVFTTTGLASWWCSAPLPRSERMGSYKPPPAYTNAPALPVFPSGARPADRGVCCGCVRPAAARGIARIVAERHTAPAAAAGAVARALSPHRAWLQRCLPSERWSPRGRTTTPSTSWPHSLIGALRVGRAHQPDRLAA